MQVVGREVRAEVGTVPEDRAVLHQAALQEDLLAVAHVVARVDDVPRGSTALSGIGGSD